MLDRIDHARCALLLFIESWKGALGFQGLFHEADNVLRFLLTASWLFLLALEARTQQWLHIQLLREDLSLEKVSLFCTCELQMLNMSQKHAIKRATCLTTRQFFFPLLSDPKDWLIDGLPDFELQGNNFTVLLLSTVSITLNLFLKPSQSSERFP